MNPDAAPPKYKPIEQPLSNEYQEIAWGLYEPQGNITPMYQYLFPAPVIYKQHNNISPRFYNFEFVLNNF